MTIKSYYKNNFCNSSVDCLYMLSPFSRYTSSPPPTSISKPYGFFDFSGKMEDNLYHTQSVSLQKSPFTSPFLQNFSSTTIQSQLSLYLFQVDFKSPCRSFFWASWFFSLLIRSFILFYVWKRPANIRFFSNHVLKWINSV